MLVGVAAANFVAYAHARAFTRFAPAGRRTPPPEKLSFRQKVQVLALGVDVPRPVNVRTPANFGLPYERHVFPGNRGIALEAWVVPLERARGTVVLFHGHAGSKDS